MVKWIRFLQKPIAHNDGNVRFFGLLIHTPVCVNTFLVRSQTRCLPAFISTRRRRERGGANLAAYDGSLFRYTSAKESDLLSVDEDLVFLAVGNRLAHADRLH